MLIKSVYDLIRAFVVGACNHLVTVVTVENQHVNHLSIFELLPTRGNLLLGSRKQNNPLNGACLTVGDIRLTPQRRPGLSGKEKGSGQPAMNGSKQAGMAIKTIVGTKKGGPINDAVA